MKYTVVFSIEITDEQLRDAYPGLRTLGPKAAATLAWDALTSDEDRPSCEVTRQDGKTFHVEEE